MCGINIYIYIYIYKVAICLFVCLSVCSCLYAGLTAEMINMKFGMHTHIWSACAIGYMNLNFEVFKGHFRSNKFLWQIPSGGGGRRGDTEETERVKFENPGAVAFL